MSRVASTLRLFRGVGIWEKAAHSTSLSTTAAVHRAERGGNGDLKTDSKIYELRTYAIRPDKFGEYLKIMEENIDLRTAHSKLIGFWITDLGGINEVNHLWEYESYQHRADVRKALTVDKNWIDKCFSKILPMFVSQSNMLLNAFPWYTLQLEPRQGFGFYELVLFHLKPGYISQFAHRVLQGLPDRLAMGYPNPLGFWYTEFGQSNQRVVTIWPHKNLDERATHREELFQLEEWSATFRDTAHFFNDITVKATVPAPFSPIR